MVLLIDANVVLDYVCQREPHYECVNRLIDLTQKFKCKTYVAFHSMSVIWYVLRKHAENSRRRELLFGITDVFTVTSASHEAVVDAIGDENFSDFEDCLQEKCALQCGADYIVTRNVKDFAASKIPAVTPAKMCEIISQS